jgi:hypothetical protein
VVEVAVRLNDPDDVRSLGRLEQFVGFEAAVDQ